MRKSEGQKIPEKEIFKQKLTEFFERGRLLVRRARRCSRENLEQFRFVEQQTNHFYYTTREKSPVVFLCLEGGGFHDPGALFAQQHQKHPHKREEKFVISFIIFPNTLFGDKMILSMIMMSVTPMRAMFG